MDDGQLQKPKRNGVWKLAVGLLLVLGYINTMLNSNRDVPAALQYSNETQRIAGNVTQFVIFLLGVGLILAWLLPAWLSRTRKRATAVEDSSGKDLE